MPPGRRSAADVAAFQRALRTRRPPRTSKPDLRTQDGPTRYDESGFALPAEGRSFASRVRRTLFSG